CYKTLTAPSADDALVILAGPEPVDALFVDIILHRSSGGHHWYRSDICFSAFSCSNLISCQPGTPASAWSVVPRALCRSDTCPSRLCSRTVSIQSGGALDQSDLCTCRIVVY